LGLDQKKRKAQRPVNRSNHAAVVLRGGLLGGAFDPLRSAHSISKLIRGDHGGCITPDILVHRQGLS